MEQWGTVAAGVRIRLPNHTEIVVWTAHLAYDPYGPYDACFDGMTPAELLDREHEAGRPQQMSAILAAMADDLAAADDVPVLLTGDFNTPSHLDWVPAAQRPSLRLPTRRLADDQAGRGGRPHGRVPRRASRPGRDAGHDVVTDLPAPPRVDRSAEPQDRIDFVLFAGTTCRWPRRTATWPGTRRRTASTRTTDGRPTTRR